MVTLVALVGAIAAGFGTRAFVRRMLTLLPAMQFHERVHRKVARIRESRAARERAEWFESEWFLGLMGCTGALIGAGFVPVGYVIPGIFGGAAAGVMAAQAVKPVVKHVHAQRHLRDWALLLRGTVLFMLRGIPLHQAMDAARPMAPSISEVIRRALGIWTGSTPDRAFEQLARDLPYTAVRLTLGLLRQAATLRAGESADFIRQQAEQITQAQHMANMERAAMLPNWYAIYQFLPVVAFLAVLLLSLLRYAQIQFSQLGY